MTDQYKRLLMKAFGFTEAELKANQNGLVAKTQKWKIRWKRNTIGKLLLALYFIFSTFPASAILYYRITTPQNFESGTHHRTYMYILNIFIFFALLWFVFRIPQLYWVKGEIVLGTWIANTRYFVHLHNKTFYINSKQFYALKNGEFYTFYYVDGLILSVSPEVSAPHPPDYNPKNWQPFFRPRRIMTRADLSDER